MAISKKELVTLMHRLHINARGRRYIFDIVQKNTPSRRPTGKFMCVHDTIASRKQGWTRDSEARSTELPLLLWCEFNQDVLAYYSQAEPITITYVNRNGKLVSHQTKADFLIIKRDEIFLAECKKQSFIEKSINEEPNKFSRTEPGYSFPAAEAAARELGIQYRVFTDRDFTPTFTRNCVYLLNFVDDLSDFSEDLGRQVVAYINNAGNRVRLDIISQAFGQKNILQLLFHQIIFMEFDRQLLCQPDFVWIYADRRYRDAIQDLVRDHDLIAVSDIIQLTNVEDLWWGTEHFEVLLYSPELNTGIKLRHSLRGIVTLSENELRALIDRQELYIKLPRSIDATAASLLCSKKAKQIDGAQKRISILNNSAADIHVSDRTIFRWKQRLKESSDPLAALISNTEKRGNRTPRLRGPVLELMETFFQKLLKESPPSIQKVWESFKESCEQQQLPPCSLKTFHARFSKIDKYKRTLLQKGFKAAYALGPQPREIDIDWDLPYHGDYIFELAHVDHSPIEITLVSKLNRAVLEGTLYLSIMYDGHSRVILAVYITFEKPSYRSTMMLLRECYRRFKRLPIFIVVDHGPDFESNYFDATLADLGCHKRRRPKSASRHGSPIERVFGCTETELIHTLAGNKQLQKLGRGLSTTHKPERFADLTPDEFEPIFKEYAYLQYPNRNRRGISETPNERWDASAAKFEELPGTKVFSEASFYIATLPDADGDGTRIIKKSQLEFRGTTYRLSTEVPGYSGERASVPVKYDPYDLAYIYACINDRWVKLGTNDELIRECHDKGVRLSYMEVFSRRLRNSRRRRQGAKVAIDLHNRNEQKEQHNFNRRDQPFESPFTTSQSPDLPPIQRPFKIDLSKIKPLNSSEN